jgi:hypothetical protein
MKTIEPEKAKFVAVVESVKELRLIGNANLDFWNERLSGKPYQALRIGGRAEITIGASALVWKGFRFNELTVSLAVAAKENPFEQIGYLLLHAFNSNRFFAFCERTFFSAPYHFGKTSLRETAPCSMNAVSKERIVLKAEMSAAARETIEENERWTGAVFLPVAKGEKYFIAELSGVTKICPFVATDRIQLQADAKDDVFARLADSGFKGKEWRVRAEAFHAKSNTYGINI